MKQSRGLKKYYKIIKNIEEVVMNRVELLIFKHKNIDDFIKISQKYVVANVYIKVDLKNISQTRKRLIDLNYTTRLFITVVDGKKTEYIFGKFKKSKGVFNEYCKNSIIRENIDKVITISSNNGDSVILDDKTLIEKIKGDRLWIII